MKKILGLDLGTNSIGWALVEQDFEKREGKILGMGSRIIPMNNYFNSKTGTPSKDPISDFGGGIGISITKGRTKSRSARRLYQRDNQRRERLHRVLNILGFLPEHYSDSIDFEKQLGHFKNGLEPKINYKQNEIGKNDFLFKDSFFEMVEEFKNDNPALFYLRKNGEESKIPHDWTIYYLRKKALKEIISKDELAWIILNFNQKRGYYQLRGEEDDDAIKTAKTRRYFDKQIIKGISDTNQIYKGLKVLILELEDGNKGKIFKKEIPQWVGIEKSVIVTVDVDKEGNDKFEDNGLISQRFSIPTDDEWETEWKSIKLKTEKDLKDSDGTVGVYIYENLLKNPNQKIKGKLVRTIERKFYKDELKAILEKQIELQPRLFTEDLYNDCVRELYRNNASQQLSLSKRDFVHLFLDDIIFYQRPLKSQKSSIGNCSLEYRMHKVNKKDEKGNLIKNSFEKDKNGKDIEIKAFIKVIPKSNPYYQEFRVWQWLHNLKIYQKEDEIEVTNHFIKTGEDIENLFKFLMSQDEVDHKSILKHFLTTQGLKGKLLNAEIAKYRWNYVYNSEKDESKKYPMNRTGYRIRKQFEKVENVPANFLAQNAISREKKKKLEITREYQLWHIIYSVSDKREYEQALSNFANHYDLINTSFVENFKTFKPFDREYGSYSEKAIKRLLPLMRVGKYWIESDITDAIKERANTISERLKSITDVKEIESIADDDISKQILKSFFGVNELKKGLKLYQASYLVYGRHSESEESAQWHMSHDIQQYLYNFKQHQLRNPIVEQVITETLRVVKDVWDYYAEKDAISYELIYDEQKKKKVRSYKKYFDEVHIELGREMKNPADERERMTKSISDNENTNLRIKAILTELMNDSSVGNVRPYSPTQQEALKIYEDGVLNSGLEIPDYVKETLKKFNERDLQKRPTSSEINRYKLWLEQKYRSPYTGQPILLSQLFTTEFEIEHIIPKSRFLDDSFSNKVICEAAVNKLKDNQLGLEFIKNHHGEKVECGKGKIVEISSESTYKDFVKQYYAKNRGKQSKLLLEEIPNKMIERQLNDTRYISKFISNVLSNIVRSEKDDDGINSKKLIPVNGKITGILKQDWGLNDIWNDLIFPRFDRLNQLTKTKDFTTWNEQHQKFLPTVPLKLSRGFQKKRVDHRHHALDALIIACATQDHVQYLNNENAKSQKFHLQRGLAKKIRKFEMNEISKMKKNEKGVWVKSDEKIKKEVPCDFFKPWDRFTVDAKNELEKIVVSFKQNLRVINKATNKYESYKDENGNLRIGKDGKPKKDFVLQKGTNWAIRKPMHEETVSGIVNLTWVKVEEGKMLTATRKTVDKTFNLPKIEKITDTGIQEMLRKYLKQEKFKVVNNNGEISYNSELAFSPEGIENMNKNIAQYNNDKPHQPIFKVRIYEKGSGRFVLGEKVHKRGKNKYVQGAPNLFFGIYTNEQLQCKGADKKPTCRCFEAIPLNIVIERLKQGVNPVPEVNKIGERRLFHLSPRDLVYVPIGDEKVSEIDFNNLTNEERDRLYIVNDFSGATCYFKPNRLAKEIIEKEVDMNYDDKKNKSTGSVKSKTASLDGVQIKEVCIKLKVDRLGNIEIANQ
jgi:CRISPR-associated endonuclease Csn1